MFIASLFSENLLLLLFYKKFWFFWPSFDCNQRLIFLFQDYAKLFPVLHYGREYLQEVTGESMNLAHGRESEQRAGRPSTV